MNDYLFIIRGGDVIAQTKSPNEIQTHMQKWQTWMKGLAEAGKLIGGQPLAKEARSIVDGGTKVIDKPLAEAKEIVGGYIMVKSETLDAAAEIAKEDS